MEEKNLSRKSLSYSGRFEKGARKKKATKSSTKRKKAIHSRERGKQTLEYAAVSADECACSCKWPAHRGVVAHPRPVSPVQQMEATHFALLSV